MLDFQISTEIYVHICTLDSKGFKGGWLSWTSPTDTLPSDQHPNFLFFCASQAQVLFGQGTRDTVIPGRVSKTTVAERLQQNLLEKKSWGKSGELIEENKERLAPFWD